MNFIGSEARKRTAYVETIVAETDYALRSMPTVERQMGTSAKDATLTFMKDIFVPNIRHNVLSIPKAHKQHGLPVIAMKAGENYALGDGFEAMTAMQRRRAAEVLGSWKLSTDSIQMLDKITVENAKATAIKVPTSPDVRAVTTSAFSGIMVGSEAKNMGTSHERILLGRPIVGLIMGRANPVTYPPSLVHEMRHVMQRNMSPIRPADVSTFTKAKLRDELEAYHLGATFEQGLFQSDDPRYAGNIALYNNAFVDNIRQNHVVNPKDPFMPSGTLMKVLADIELDDIY